MPECSNCGEHVSPEYFRVYAVDGELVDCLHCTGVSVGERLGVEIK